MESFRAIVKFIDAVSEWTGKICSFLIVSIIALSLFEVFTRRFLGKPTVWTHETLSYLFAATVLLTIGYALRHGAHANVDILYERFSPKTKAIVDLICYTVFLGIFTVLFLWNGISFAATSWAIMERTASAFNFYVFPAKTLLPLGAFLLLIQAISDILKRIFFLVKGEQL